MKTELIDALFEKHPINHVIFTGLTEPFLAPDKLFYVADKLEAKAAGAFTIYTNGNLLNRQHVERLFTYRSFYSLHMSLHAVTDEMRQKMMRLDLAKAEENMDLLLQLRREAGREEVQLGVVMLQTDQNIQQAPAFRERWGKKFEGFPNCLEPGVFNPTNWRGKSPTPWLKDLGPNYCQQWDCVMPTISVDGYIYQCCYSADNIVGHCLDDGDLERWFTRKELLGVVPGDASTIPERLCGGCSGKRAMAI